MVVFELIIERFVESFRATFEFSRYFGFVECGLVI